MKEPRFKRLMPVIYFLVSACGQPGPLYLPTDKPPVYVPPEAQTNEEQINKAAEVKPGAAQQELTSPPQPDSNQPKKH